MIEKHLEDFHITDYVRNDKFRRENYGYLYEEGELEYPWEHGGRNYIEINWSSIFTKLIQVAGRFCERYASDLYFYLKELDLNFHDYKEDNFLILGFRESGVDSNENVIRNYNDNCYYYRAIYVVECTKKEDNTIFLELMRYC